MVPRTRPERSCDAKWGSLFRLPSQVADFLSHTNSARYRADEIVKEVRREADMISSEAVAIRLKEEIDLRQLKTGTPCGSGVRDEAAWATQGDR